MRHHARRGLAGFASSLCVALLLALAPSAGAATITSHQLSSSFDGAATPAGSLGLGGDQSGGGSSKADLLAFNQHAKRLYAIDSIRDVVNVYTTAGALDSQVKGKDVPQGSLDLDGASIAVDDSGGPTQGRIYIAAPDLKAIFAFNAAGGYLFQTSLGFVNEGYGDIAVAADASVWVSKVTGVGQETNYKLSPAGALLQTVPLSSVVPNGPISGKFGQPGSLAFGAGGDLYAADTQFNRVLRLSPSGDSLKGAFAYEFSVGRRGFEADPATGNVYVSHGTRIATFDAEGNFIDSFGEGTLPVDAGYALAVDHSADTVYVADLNADEIKAYSPISATAPEATLTPTTAITDDSATLNASIDPAGHPTEYHIDYKHPAEIAWNVGPTQSAGDGTDAVAVSRAVSGLDFGTTYEVRVQAVSTDTGKRDADSATFKTMAHAPEAETVPAAPRGTTTARLNARIDPNGADTTYYFEYGQDESYGTSAPASLDAEAGSARGAALVSQEIAGLTPGTTYHYRVVAANEIDKAEGEDLTFTTRTAAEVAAPKRGIELVNSPDKSAQNVAASYLAPGRDRVLWSTTGGTPLSNSGGSLSFLADRSANGWASRSLAPPIGEQLGGGQLVYSPVYASRTFDAFFVNVLAGVLAKTARYLVRLDDAGHQDFLVQSLADPTKFGADDDLSHIYNRMNEPLGPGNVESETGPENVYELASGTPVLVGRMPDGSVPSCGAEMDTHFSINEGWVATDPEEPRAYFLSSGSGDCAAPAQLYLRDLEAETTTLVSGPPLAGPLRPAYFIRASADGRTAIFLTATRLDPADTDEASDLYRYREGEGVACLTCEVSGFEVDHQGTTPSVLVSADLTRVYFTSQAQLTPDLGARRGGPGIYLLREGELRFVAPINRAFTAGIGNNALPAADGRVLVFEAAADGITTDARADVPQFYRYDDADGSLECITCPPAGQKQPGGTLGARAQTPLRPSQYVFDSLGVSASAETAAFVSAVAYVPEDVNRSYDVYEWRNGTLSLITDGVTKYGAGLLKPSLSGISRDGTNIFFTIGARLTGHELDQSNQAYVARIGGGFAPPPTPPVVCIEDSCQGPLQAPPRNSAPGSASFTGPGNERAAQQRKKAKKQKAKQRKAQQRKKAKQRKAKKQKRRAAKQRAKRAANHGQGGK